MDLDLWALGIEGISYFLKGVQHCLYLVNPYDFMYPTIDKVPRYVVEVSHPLINSNQMIELFDLISKTIGW